MKMKKIAMACGAVLMGATSLAQAEFSANIGATSNYIWRGVTQTMDSAAISGGVDFADDSGLYAGSWVSNIDWGTTGAEVDFYAGYGGEAGDIGYDVGAIYYYYPATSHSDSDFVEVYGSVSFQMFTAGLAYTVSGQNDGGLFDDGDLYYYAGASFDLPKDFGLGLTVGHYNFENSSAADYTHYQVDLSKSAGDMGDFTLSFSKATDGSGDTDPKFFVSWSKSF